MPSRAAPAAINGNPGMTGIGRASNPATIKIIPHALRSVAIMVPLSQAATGNRPEAIAIRRATRCSVGGWVLNKLARPSALNGL